MTKINLNLKEMSPTNIVKGNWVKSKKDDSIHYVRSINDTGGMRLMQLYPPTEDIEVKHNNASQYENLGAVDIDAWIFSKPTDDLNVLGRIDLPEDSLG